MRRFNQRFFQGIVSKRSIRCYSSDPGLSKIFDRYQPYHPELWERINDTLRGDSANLKDLFELNQELIRRYEGPEHNASLGPVIRALNKKIEALAPSYFSNP